MHKKLRFFLSLSVLLLGTGCQSLRDWKANGFKVGPNYRRPCVADSSGWIDETNPAIVMKNEESTEWWRVFNDPVLEELVQAAYQQNLTLRTAGLRVLQARLQRDVSQRNLWPQSQEAYGKYTRTQVSPNAARFFPPRRFDDWNTGFDLTWEADVWGKFRRQIEADDAGLDAQIESYDDILLTLIADVATNYIELRGFDDRLRLAEQNVAIQKGSLKLAEARLLEGSDSELDVQQATANLKDTEALIPTLRQKRRLSVNAIAILLGVPPSELYPYLHERGTLPTIPQKAVVGIPADLIRRRPDVRNAERNIARECALIGVNEAELYPHFTLTGEINLNAEYASNLFASGSTAGFISPGFRWKILNYGRLMRSIEIQKLQFQAAIVDYENSVLTAQREVEDALVQFLESKIRAEKLNESANAASRSVELVNTQYREGQVDFGQVFLLEGNLVSSQDSLIAARSDIALALVRAYKAMGGGWQLRMSTPYSGTYEISSVAMAPQLIKFETNSVPEFAPIGAPDDIPDDSASPDGDRPIEEIGEIDLQLRDLLEKRNLEHHKPESANE